MSALTDKLKEKGLDVAEDMARAAFLAGLEIAEEEIKKSKNSVDDLLLPAIPWIRDKGLAAIDKIDGEAG